MHRHVLISTLVMLNGISLSACANDGDCFHYNGVVTLSGVVQSQTFLGPPGYGETPDIDRRDIQDVLLLDEPICTMASAEGGAERNETEITLEAQGREGNGSQMLAGKRITVTGLIQHTQTAEGTNLILSSYQTTNQDDVNERNSSLDDTQKRDALKQFKRFQQALKDGDIAGVKSFITFPLKWDSEFPWIKEETSGPREITEEVFTQHFPDIVQLLNPVTHIEPDLQTLTLKEYRISGLSAEAQKKAYYPADNDDEDNDLYYYLEGDQKHFVKGVCDKVSNAFFYGDELQVMIGTSSNKQLPGLSQACDHQPYILSFGLIQNQLNVLDVSGAD